MASQTHLFDNKPIPEELLQSTLQMKLNRFRFSGLAVQIHSKKLKGDIWFAADRNVQDALKRENPDVIVYTAGELQEIVKKGMTEAGLEFLHASKSVFKGRLLKHNSKGVMI